SDHDALTHRAVFSSGSDGILFCVHCAAERYNRAPDFRKLALLDGIRIVLSAHGPRSLGNDGTDACVPMLLRGIESSNSGIVQAVTDITLMLKEELQDPVGVLASLVSSIVSLGLPRASSQLYLVGQLLTSASRDRVVATTLGNACFHPLGEEHHAVEQQLHHAIVGMDESGGRIQLRGFGSFLAAHALSASCPDHVKSDVLYVAMELLDCCTTAGMTAGIQRASTSFAQGLLLMPPPPESDPFVTAMLAVPRLLARRASCDEPLQLHSIAYLATAVRYIRQRTAMGVPGWSSRCPGVPEVLVALFNGAQEFAPQEMVGCGREVGKENRSPSSSSGGLCSTFKTLLMSPSYRVRSATARLITSLSAGDPDRYSEDPVEAHGNGSAAGGGAKGTGLFCRETLLRAGVTDFLFEAIKSEREGTPRRYLEAAEALALSPVEFFHADNFSMKFAAPVLLGVSRAGCGVGGGGWAGDGSTLPHDESYDEAGLSTNSGDDELATFSSSSRLLLQALVTLPSSGGVLEELLASAAISTQPDMADKPRAIRLAADILGLVASGDILLSKARQLRPAWSETISTGVSAPLPIESADQLSAGEKELHSVTGDIILQCARIYESLLHMAEEWVSSREAALGRPSVEEGVALADLVFGAYERTLPCQFDVVNSPGSRNLAHDVAFLSSMGAAVDAASAVLSCKKRRREEAVGSGSSKSNSCNRSGMPRPAPFLDARPSFIHVEELLDDFCAPAAEGSLLRAGEIDSTPASCLQTVLRMTVERDIVSWMLDLYAQCGSATPDRAVDPRTSSQTFDGGNETCGATTRELLAEVLQSFLYAQGWVNGLRAHGLDCPPHTHERDDDNIGDSTFGATVHSLLKSWVASGSTYDGKTPLPLDQYVMSRLGTRADNGGLCKVAALLVSLSPSFLGVLYPHAGCRVDSAVTLLRYVKTVPEAVFCLNMFSHAVLDAAAGRGDQIDGDLEETLLPSLSDGLSTAVAEVLARFSVGELALSAIPLSAIALSFTLLAGCEAFIADWLVAAPLARIKQALREFGAFSGRQRHATSDMADISNCSEKQEEEQPQSTPVAVEYLHRDVLIGIMGAALSRWRAEVDREVPQQSHSDAVICRLTCVLLMAPDIFFHAAFDLGSRGNGTLVRQQRARQELADALDEIVPKTLEGLSAGFSAMVVSRRRDRADDNHRSTSKLACVSQVSQLASAFLHARCNHSCYSLANSDSPSDTPASPSSTCEPSEVLLARACGGVLQWMLDPRRNRDSSDCGGNIGGESLYKALLSVLNLLCALLALQRSRQGLTAALQDSHAAFSEVLSPSAKAVECLMGWLDDAPDVLAAFLQACTLWNATEPAGSGSDDDRGFLHLCIPLQVLGEVLSSGVSGPCFTAGGGGASANPPGRLKRKASSPATRRGVRASLLRVLAVRCVETSARARSFSRQEVIELQLTLQGFACGSSATLACAAHGAIQALWESYAELLQSGDLVGQSWNPFMVECSLENGLRSLSSSCDQESQADLLMLLALGEDPEEFRVDAPALVSAVGKLLCCSAGKSCPRLRCSEVVHGCNVELLSTAALVSVHQCAALLATKLRTILVEGVVDQRKGQQQRGTAWLDGESASSTSKSSGRSSEGHSHWLGMGGGEAFHLIDALMQLIRVLVCIKPLPQQALCTGLERTGLVEALTVLHRALLGFREGGNRQLEGNVEPPEQVVKPLSSGAYHDGGGSHGASLNIYEGVFFVKHDSWRWLSCSPTAISLAELADDAERLVFQLSGAPRAGSRESGEGRGVHDQASNGMAIDSA
ncbi:unnamed protein product, partial [Scytosiphon promiscuus]